MIYLVIKSGSDDYEVLYNGTDEAIAKEKLYNGSSACVKMETWSDGKQIKMKWGNLKHLQETEVIVELPYIRRTELNIQTDYLYNPKYGDGRTCQCGHVYYRHFDSYEDNYPCGCKYCGCSEFIEMEKEAEKIINEWRKAYLEANGSRSPDVACIEGWFEIYGYKKASKAAMLKRIKVLHAKGVVKDE